MALPPGKQQLSPVPREFAVIWAQLIQLQLESLLRRLDRSLARDLVLAHAVRSLEICLGLEKSRCVLQQDLGVLRLCDGGGKLESFELM
jgi:hypothetical protein